MVFACSLIFLSITASCISQPGVGNGTNVSNSAPVNRQTPPPPALSGTASQKDGTNDVADGDGRKPPANLGGVDLVNMQLQIVESNLQVTFESSDPLPSSIPAGASTLWQVEVWSKEGSQGYYLGAKLVGSEWQAFIFNVKTATNMYVQSPSVSGKKLVANFPLSQLPNLGSTFTWSAVSEYDGKWGDEVPDEGKASFPAT
jgi:hypothetical protein